MVSGLVGLRREGLPYCEGWWRGNQGWVRGMTDGVWAWGEG